MSRADLASQWRTSSHSSGQGTECVEVAGLGEAIAARDSKNPGGPMLGFTHAEWSAFLDDVKRGAFDLA